MKIKHRITIWSSKFILRYIAKRIENRDPNRYLYTHVNIIYSIQNVEATQVSTDG